MKMRYWLIFRSSNHWALRRLLKDCYQHVGVLYNDGVQWLELDPRFDLLKFTALPYSANFDLVSEIAKVQPIVQYDVEIKDSLHLHIVPSWITCVTMVKYILSMRSLRHFFIWTPWQLYKYCKKLQKKRMSNHDCN